MTPSGIINRTDDGYETFDFDHPTPALWAIDTMIWTTLHLPALERLVRSNLTSDYATWRDLAARPDVIGNRAEVSLITRPDTHPNDTLELYRRLEARLLMRGYERIFAESRLGDAIMERFGFLPERENRTTTLYTKQLLEP